MLLAAHAFSVASDIDWERVQGELAQDRWESWEPVTSASRWCGGARPDFAGAHDGYFVDVQQGSSTFIQLLAGESIALRAVDSQSEPDVEVWSSDGSRAFVSDAQLSSTDRGLVARFPDWRSRIVRVHAPRANQKLAIFVLRPVSPAEASPYRKQLFPESTGVLLKGQHDSVGQRFYLLERGETVVVRVGDQRRVRVMTRLAYRSGDASSRQRYRVLGDFGLNRQRAFHTTRADSSTVYVGERRRVLGELRSAYFDCGEEQYLRLTTDQDVFIRVLGQVRTPFLIPKWNDPNHRVNESLAWRRGLEGVEAHPLAEGLDPVHPQSLLDRIVDLSRRNDIHEAGVAAAYYANLLVESFPASETLKRHCDALVTAGTESFSLVPDGAFVAHSGGRSRFVVRRAHAPELRPEEPIVATGHFQEIGVADGSAVFVQIDAERKSVYRIPSRSFETSVRVLISGVESDGADLSVRIGSETRHLRLVGSKEWTVLTENDSAARAALALRSKRHLAGAFGLPEIVESVELLLPADIDQVEVSSPSSRLRVALQYRRSRTESRLTEAEFEAAVEVVEKTSGSLEWFRECILSYSSPTVATPEQRLLRQHWYPLIRRVAEARRRFQAAARVFSQPHSVQADAESIDAWTREAEAAESDANWTLALDAWSKVAAATSNGSDALDRERARRAIHAKAKVLIELDELALARSTLEPLVGKGDAEAMSLLRFLYSGDAERVVSLDAAILGGEVSTENILQLMRSLPEIGDFRSVLNLGMLLPKDERPVEEMLIAALQSRWWGRFEELRESLPSARDRQFWRGLRHLRDDRYEEAENALSLAREPGPLYSSYLREGRDIVRLLESGDLDDRVEGVTAWERWAERSPGRSRWVGSEESIRSAAGTFLVRGSVTLRDSAFFRATAERPVEIEVHGPGVYAIEIRPIVENPGTLEEGWLRIESDGWSRMVPITRDGVTKSLQTLDAKETHVGWRQIVEIDVPPGRRRYRVMVGDFPVVVRPRRQVPLVEFGILPRLTTENVDRVLRGDFVSRSQLPLSEIAVFDSRTGVVTDQSFELRGAAEIELDPDALKALEDARPRNSTDRLSEGVLVGTEQWSRLYELPVSSEPRDLYARLSQFLYLAERVPSERKRALAYGERLFARHRDVQELRSVYSRLTRGLVWKRRVDFSSDAGVRYRVVEGWNPESESLQVRRSLIPDLDRHDHLIVGSRRLVLSVRNTKSKILKMTCSLVLLDESGFSPLTVRYQVDDGDAATIVLSPQSSSRELHLPAVPGEHRVAVWVENPVVNQFLRVRFDGSSVEEQSAVPIVAGKQRGYRVATQKQAVTFLAQGPAWFRISETIEGRDEISYRFVDEGNHRVVLEPRAGQKEALFRVFERKDDGEKLRSTSPEVPWSPLSLIALDLQSVSGIDRETDAEESFESDGLRLDTWSVGMLFVRRRALEEDIDGELKPDEYTEIRASHRIRNENLSAWFRTEVLGRAHVDGGPSFGVRERALFRPESWRGVDLTLRAAAHAQWINGDSFSPSGDLEWSLSGSAEVSRPFEIRENLNHRPAFGLFGSSYSIDRGTPDALVVTDQNVFTSYKGSHRAGWRLSESIDWFPWVDTRLAARGSIVSNEDLSSLDHVALRMKGQQRLGPAQVELGYRLAYFLSDDNRSTSRTRHLLSVGARYDLWLRRSGRLELVASYSLDVDRSDSSFIVGLVWHDGDRSGYRDFGPDELVFRGLRRDQMFRALGGSR